MRRSCEARDCQQPTHDVLCAGCRDQLVTALRELAITATDRGEHTPGLLDALAHAAARRRATGSRVRTRTHPGPPTGVPFDQRATRLQQRATLVISTWARSFADAFPALRPTYRDLPAACAWLAAHPRELATFWEAGLMWQEITDLHAAIEAAVDRPPERRYAGQCSASLAEGGSCEQDLYARPEQAVLRCPHCGTTHDVARRRDILAAAVADQLATATECSRIAPHLLGRELSASTIRSWAADGRLTPRPPHPHDERRAPRYRLGDVVALAQATPTRRRVRQVAIGGG